jgi:glycine cleavage system H protein
MTVLLVLATLITFLAADHFVQRARAARAAEDLLPRGVSLPEGVSLATNHTWLKKQRNVVTIGLDEFLGGMLGVVESMVLPEAGSTVTPAHQTIALRNGNRALRLAVPVDGKIMKVNTRVLADPSLARTDPYGNGWLLKVKTESSASIVSHFLLGTGARQWLKEQMELAKEFLAGQTAMPQLVTLQDGGMPADGILQHCDARVWAEFERRFAGLAATDRTTK